jgi:hypothetical protein
MPGARRCVDSYAQVRSDDTVLILFDRPSIADALCQAIREREESKNTIVECFYLSPPLRPIKSLTPGLGKAVAKASVVFSVVSPTMKSSSSAGGC